MIIGLFMIAVLGIGYVAKKEVESDCKEITIGEIHRGL